MNVIYIRVLNGKSALVFGPRMTPTSRTVQKIAARLRNINSARQVRAERNGK